VRLKPACVTKSKYMEDVLCNSVFFSFFKNREILREFKINLADEFQKCIVGDLLGIGIR
jgi:hypothetical protein